MDTIFIALEGIDGSGKTTQCELLQEYLEKQGKTVELVSFPSYDTDVGKEIKKILESEMEFNPFYLSTLYNLDIFFWVEGYEYYSHLYDYIIFDRFLLSNFIYNTARYALMSEDIHDYCKTTGVNHKFSKVEIEKITDDLLGLDINYIILGIDTSISSELLEKTGKDLDRFEKNIELQNAVSYSYIEYSKEANIPLINCISEEDGSMLSKEFIHDEIVKIVEAIKKGE